MPTTEPLKVIYERTIQVDQYEPKRLSAEVPYLAGNSSEETMSNMMNAFSLAAQVVTAQLGIEYEIKDNVLHELPQQTRVAQVKEIFPGAEEAAPIQPVQPRGTATRRPVEATGPIADEIYAFLDSYHGDDQFFSDLSQKLKRFGSLSQKQVEAVKKSKSYTAV